MAAAQIFVPGWMPSFDRNGDTCVSELYFYTNDGTYAPKTVYTSSALTTALPFPVVSNASGVVPQIWADSAQMFTVSCRTIEADPRTETLRNIAPSIDVISVAGPPGANGSAATIAVGSVMTGVPGSSVSVSNSGTSTAAVFDFTIPRGSPGTGNMSSTGVINANDIAVFTDASTIKAGVPSAIRSALGLGGAALLNVGTSAGTVAAGDDGRITSATPSSRLVSGGGLVTGGGNLSADRTLTVTAAVSSDIRIGTSTSTAVTPKSIYDASGFVGLTDGSPLAVDFSTFINASFTLPGNRTLGAPTNLKDGQSGLILIIQNGTGGSTLTFNSAYKFAGGTPTLSTAANAVDGIAYVIRGSFVYCSLLKGFA